MLCSVVTMNSNWEILSKNLVFFKDKVWWSMKNAFGVSQKNSNFRGGGFMKNQYIGEQGGGLPKKRRGLGQFADLRGLGKKEGRGIYFWGRGVDTPMYTILSSWMVRTIQQWKGAGLFEFVWHFETPCLDGYPLGPVRNY